MFQTNTMATGGLNTDTSVPTERCYIHKTKLIEMFCKNHDEVCCTSCVAANHRSCDSVTSITDIVKKGEGKEAKADSLVQELNTMINVCLKIKTTIEKDMSEIDKTKEVALDEIVKQRKDLDTLFDQLEDTSRKKVENEHRKLYNGSAEVKKRVAEYEIRLQKRLDTLHLSGGNEVQRFVSEKLGHKDLVEISKFANTILRENITIFEYDGDSKLREILSAKKSPGEIRRYEKCRPGKTLYRVKRTHELNVKLPSDKHTCNIMSSCLDDRGNLLLTDNINQSLKRVNVQTQRVIGRCVMPGCPIAVCCVNKDEAAVSMHDRSIQIVSLRNQMKITRRVNLDYDCWGLACSEEKMYVTDGGKKLYIHDISGKLISIVESDNIGENIFSDNRHVTFDRYSGEMYVIDVVKGLISFGKHGEYLSSLPDKTFDTKHSICSDGKGIIFVGGWGSGTVIQFGVDTQMLGQVVRKSHGLVCIWSVCFDERQKRLIVSTCDNDNIHIFDLE